LEMQLTLSLAHTECMNPQCVMDNLTWGTLLGEDPKSINPLKVLDVER
jgi:hypothetical protein